MSIEPYFFPPPFRCFSAQVILFFFFLHFTRKQLRTPMTTFISRDHLKSAALRIHLAHCSLFLFSLSKQSHLPIIENEEGSQTRVAGITSLQRTGSLSATCSRKQRAWAFLPQTLGCRALPEELSWEGWIQMSPYFPCPPARCPLWSQYKYNNRLFWVQECLICFWYRPKNYFSLEFKTGLQQPLWGTRGICLHSIKSELHQKLHPRKH